MWNRLVTDYEIHDEAGLILVGSMAECLQDIRRYEAIVKEQGELIKDRSGSQKANPACALAREARKALHSALRQLGADS